MAQYTPYKLTDLLGRVAAAEALARLVKRRAMSDRTLQRLNSKGTGPPYIKLVNDELRYRYDYLVKWAEGRSAIFGLIEAWPVDEPTEDEGIAKTTVADVIQAVQSWKNKEMWRRALLVIDQRAFAEDQITRFEIEDSLVNLDKNKDTPREQWHNDITNLAFYWAKYITDRPIKWEGEVGVAVKHLMIAAIGEVVASERKWRAMDWATMPQREPEFFAEYLRVLNADWAAEIAQEENGHATLI